MDLHTLIKSRYHFELDPIFNLSIFSCFSLSRFCPSLMVDDDSVNDFTFLEDEASKQKKTET